MTRALALLGVLGGCAVTPTSQYHGLPPLHVYAYRAIVNPFCILHCDGRLTDNGPVAVGDGNTTGAGK